MKRSRYTAGDLDRRITVQSRFTVKDSGTGRETVTWPTKATMWAGKRDVRGSEMVAGGQLYSEQVTFFVVRWRNDLSDNDRVVCESVTYEVVHIAEVGIKEYLQVTCKRIVQP